MCRRSIRHTQSSQSWKSRIGILEHYPDLNEAQREIVAHSDGPLLVVAGPGSGKTYSIVLRALNLLLLDKALPRELVLCTFTEKAAFEMRDRLAAAAQKVGRKPRAADGQCFAGEQSRCGCWRRAQTRRLGMRRPNVVGADP
jgi:ATP-dependent exoDNAse (exonuclease V) beta subunit